jgi:hypothetical protein
LGAGFLFVVSAFPRLKGRGPTEAPPAVGGPSIALPGAAVPPRGPVKYRRENDGCVLYTVGPNIKDDGGYGLFLLGERKPSDNDQKYHAPGDDVGVRIPPPKPY